MNTINTLSTSSQPKSIFPIDIENDWNKKSVVWLYLRKTFVEMWEVSWDRLFLKHSDLQHILFEYSHNIWLEAYLDNSWYTLLHEFLSFEELNDYLAINKDLLGSIKSWRYNIALKYANTSPNEMTPITIVLAQKNGKTQLDELSLKSRLALDDIVWFPNI